jgi:small subunit ribosomal protein S17e
MQRHPEAFGSDFQANKEALEQLALIPSKHLRNRIAGYIAKANREVSADAEEPANEETGA